MFGQVMSVVLVWCCVVWFVVRVCTHTQDPVRDANCGRHREVDFRSRCVCCIGTFRSDHTILFAGSTHTIRFHASRTREHSTHTSHFMLCAASSREPERE